MLLTWNMGTYISFNLLWKKRLYNSWAFINLRQERVDGTEWMFWMELGSIQVNKREEATTEVFYIYLSNHLRLKENILQL